MVFAAATLQIPLGVSDGDTATIGGKVYTFQDVLTDVDGNVLGSGDEETSLRNIRDAVALEPSTKGVTYAASTTKNNFADTLPFDPTGGPAFVAISRAAGVHGNLIAVDTDVFAGGWTDIRGFSLPDDKLVDGVGLFNEFVDDLLSLNHMNAEVLDEIQKLTLPKVD